MDKITAYEDIRQAVTQIRRLKEGFVTNCYLSEQRAELLASKKLLELGGTERCRWLVHREKDFVHLYYIAAGVENLHKGVQWWNAREGTEAAIVDIVGANPTANTKEIEAFCQNGFEPYQRLHRMSRTTGLDDAQALDERVKFADPQAIQEVDTLLRLHFDRYSEQLPLYEELRQWADQGRILVIRRDEDKVIGFVVYELNGLTSYLRYWFVHPDYRDQKVGSALLRYFFHTCRESKRQLFWVIDTNYNAIERYRRYGFGDETTTDHVLSKNISKANK